jgi:hypothetical protein
VSTGCTARVDHDGEQLVHVRTLNTHSTSRLSLHIAVCRVENTGQKSNKKKLWKLNQKMTKKKTNSESISIQKKYLPIFLWSGKNLCTREGI